MSILNNQKNIQAVHKEGNSVQVALVSKRKSKIHIESLKTLTHPEDVKRLYSTLTPLFSALPASAILARSLEIPATRSRDLASILRFQMEPLLPYPIEESLLTFMKYHQGEGRVSLKALATKKESLNKHLEEWKEYGLEPREVSSVPSALKAFAQHRFSNEKIIIIHLSNDETSCIAVEHNKLIASFSFGVGVRLIKEEETKEKWIKETTRIIFALRKQSSFDKVVLTGYANEIKEISHLLEQFSLKILPFEEENIYAVPIGIALSKLQKEDQVDFRQEEFAFQYPLSYYLKPAALLFGLSCIVSLLLFLGTLFYFSHRERILKDSYNKLIEMATPSFPSFEGDFRKKHHLPPLENKEEEVKEFSLESIQNRLLFFEKQLKSTPDMFPLQPNIPRVSDFLAWLGSHPQVVKLNKKGERQALLQITSLNYNLVKRPDHAHKGEKYQVKIDLEFTASSPTEARQFHDALMAPNAMVDPKNEIKWNATKGRYHASFYLKDKTIYPTGGKK